MRRDAPGPYSLDVLRRTQVPTLFGTDVAVWRARLTTWFEAETGRTLYPAQVETLMIDTLAYAMSVLGEEAQAFVEQHLVVTASESGLGRLAPNRSTPRLSAARARTTMTFALDAPRGVATLIAAGTRVAGDGATFATLEPCVIRAGALSVDVVAEAQEAGVAANGLAAGRVATLLDPIEGVRAANVTESSGGADIEALEAWRLRVANAFERISTGGSRAWYRETAMGVSAAIVDCAVVRPSPCHVDLYLLTREGGAEADLRDAVLATFDASEALDIRFGDLVRVAPAVGREVACRLALRGRGMEASVRDDAAALALAVLDARDFRGERDALRALAQALFGGEIVSGWGRCLGADIAPSAVEAVVKALPGVVDAELSGVGFMTLAAHEFLRPASLLVDVEELP